MSAGHFKARVWLGAAGLFATVAAAQGADRGIPLEISAEGSFPLKYTETVTGNTRQNTTSAAPYLALQATAYWQPDFSTSLFSDGGRERLGGFRDNDNTFFTYGGNAVKHWDKSFSTGVSVEHTTFYDGTFGPISNTANDFNIFARYQWHPNPNLRINPSVTATVRLGDDLVVQRYTYHLRVEIEQRLYRDLWFVTAPRIRYADYVGVEAGRRDVSSSLLAGIKYEIAPGIDFRTLVGVEDRSSTISGKSFDRFVAGASLDYKIDFMR